MKSPSSTEKFRTRYGTIPHHVRKNYVIDSSHEADAKAVTRSQLFLNSLLRRNSERERFWREIIGLLRSFAQRTAKGKGTELSFQRVSGSIRARVAVA